MATSTKTVKVSEKTFKWIEDNRHGIPKTKFLEMVLVDGQIPQIKKTKKGQ